MIKLEKSLETCSLRVAGAVASGKTNLNRISTPMRFSECSLEVDCLMAANNREGSASSRLKDVIRNKLKGIKEDRERSKTRQHYSGNSCRLFLS